MNWQERQPRAERARCRDVESSIRWLHGPVGVGVSSTYDLRMPRIPRTTPHSRAVTCSDCEQCGFPPLDVVHQASPRAYHAAAYEIARFFRREFQYDMAQYDRREQTDPNCHAFLWTHNEYIGQGGIDVVYGACCFRWRDWTDAPPSWAMQWIWLHPFKRGHGHLTRAWPYFVRRFGDFYVEGPVSLAMRHFIEKCAHEPADDGTQWNGRIL